MTLAQAVTAAKELDDHQREVGLDQTALDAAGRVGFGNAAFEFSEEEIPEVLEEYSHNQSELEEAFDQPSTISSVSLSRGIHNPSLSEKLKLKVAIQERQ